MLPTFFFLSVHNFGPLLHLSYYVLSLKWWVICTLECARILDLGLEIFDTLPRALRAWTKADHSDHMGKGDIVSTWSPSFPGAFCGFCLAIAILLSSIEILHHSFNRHCYVGCWLAQASLLSTYASAPCSYLFMALIPSWKFDFSFCAR